MKKRILRYGIAVTVSFGIVLLILLLNKGFGKTGTELYRILCDAFFAAGVIYVCFGLLFFISNQGLFDMLAFGMMKFFDLFRKNVKETRYADYMEYKAAKKESRIPWIYLVIIGLILLAVASLFLYLYSR